ncbi:MAG TPA: hypothetical protein VIY10_04575 [Solirubrobacteraceae bacterium]
MTAEDLLEIESAGRRCAMCHTGRRWRQFTVVRNEGQPPVVMCPACTARYGAAPPAPAAEPAAPARAAQAAAAPAERAAPERGEKATAGSSARPAQARNGKAAAGGGQPAAGRNGKSETDQAAEPGESTPKPRSAPREDRLRKALRELPHGEHSVARIAKAAGLNHEKTVRRLETLHAAGEVQQVGKRWSNEPPSTDIEAAMDRLQARTTNLRIVRDRGSAG